ncbi:NAD(P)/FAD-dependent oxidoreductase [Pelagibius litoralis]|uniref:NAD(P)/FAD-dependent oxidoreductase n=1 Tax=Pelagibius litoralis TaxID=374515 RepID=A0A967KBS2_9PROT|nr:NAD(P)/FAD-dependent oxidoreductase [Pelagibius litoralis]NIA70514.1 NAD(P)/FAD-dependent oxidoreductase [Pelagibius litoralis]
MTANGEPQGNPLEKSQENSGDKSKEKQSKTQIVVVGGGAGGLELVRRLGDRFGRDDYDIILVERNRTHIWKPLLHEVAAGSLDANMDEVGYGGHGVRWGYRFFYGTFAGIDREKRLVHTAPLKDEDGREIIAAHAIRYDYLVLAVGGVSNDFGIPGVLEHALFLEDRTQADHFRSKLLNACLRVTHNVAQGQTDSMVRIAIVGAGATGIELAAELYNAAHALRHYGLEVFDETRLKVTILEAGPRILPALPEKLAEAAAAELEALGVEILTDTIVEEVQPFAVKMKDGKTIPAELTLWAAGVKGPDYLASLDGLEADPANRLVVRASLQTTRDDRIFAIGDCCAYTPENAERPIPPRAQAAHQMANQVFENIVCITEGRPLKDFVYNDRGSLVALSRFSTVGSLMGNLIGGRMAIEGRLARIAYTSLYRMHLIAIHGWIKGLALILVGHVNRIVRPKLKLH